MDRILNIVPEFEPEWQSHLEFWGDDEAGLSNDLAEFASYLVNNLGCIPSDKREELFLFVEACLREGDDMVKDAIATCFLENLLNAVSEKRVDACLFVNFLGTESRKFCKSWDEFTGVNTPGL
ncbi:hypothetical protein OCL06_15595 [Alteromonas sp. ASW11-19]|uniref:DUF7674 domain-containing protein n=1 Tax=Alteromonas salexigens TaxID=2982530 RepID=A0ABT2VSI2_9ALTE|nr:hypothetical protein [Alteromonas salexigens]MCU7556014.1 hypothetical protein [Alteromonas salexigens]